LHNHPSLVVSIICFQCSDTSGWPSRKASGR